MAMVGTQTHIVLTPMLKETLKDWRKIIHQMRKNPTSVLQLVSNYPHYLGYTDACKLGADGVCSSGLKHLDPTVRQLEWEEEIRQHLTTPDNK
eukprot:4251697-Ditylum_brightwellii.AAC.1